ncbi:MAG TPA: hypothetical protein VIL55_15550 [Naasia sp.]|jgi:membrane protein implicated in regulation of membrane protease activity
MTAVLASALLAAVTAMGGVLVPLAIIIGVATFAVLLVTSVRPVRRAPARMRLPQVAVAMPVRQLAGADVVVIPRVADAIVVPAEDERSAS